MRYRGRFAGSWCWQGCWILLGFGLAAGLVVTPARAQDDPAQQKISLDLVDADLRDAITLIFKDTPLNHVIADGVYGTGVTLKLDGVARERALDILLKSKGLQYSKEGGVYMIKPKPGANPGGMQAAPGGMMPGMPGPEGMPGGPAVPGQPAGVGGDPGGAAGGAAAARNSTLHQIKLTHLDPWYLLGVLRSQTGQGGQMGGVGGGGFGGMGGGMGGGMMGGMGGGMGGMGGGMGGMGGGMSSFGGGMGGMGGGMSSFGGGGSSFGGQGQGSNTGQQVFRPTLRR